MRKKDNLHKKALGQMRPQRKPKGKEKLLNYINHCLSENERKKELEKLTQ